MKKFFVVLALVMVGNLMIESAKADFVFSTSSSSATAGTNLELQSGATGSMYVWMSTNTGQTLTAVSYNVFADTVGVATGLSHLVENPGGGRWSSINQGLVNTSGNLVNNTRAFYLPGISAGTGIATTGLTDFVLHARFQVSAIGALGSSTGLTFTTTTAGVSQLGGGGNIWNSITRGTGSITISAIPEPGSLAILGLAGLAQMMRRRRR